MSTLRPCACSTATRPASRRRSRPCGSEGSVYSHVDPWGFRLPRPVARLAMQNRDAAFSILFRTAAETLRTISADPKRLGARIGGTAVLRTWNQKMQWHPHLHCLVPNGGIDVGTGAWKAGSSGFFAPVKVLGNHFRRHFHEELEQARGRGKTNFCGSLAGLKEEAAFRRMIGKARQQSRNVHAKPPFSGPGAVLRCLSRYTHRVAISDSRIVGRHQRGPPHPGRPPP